MFPLVHIAHVIWQKARESRRYHICSWESDKLLFPYKMSFHGFTTSLLYKLFLKVEAPE